VHKIRCLFYLSVVEFISDWYSIHKVATKSQDQMRDTFKLVNRLKGLLRTEIEKEEYERCV
jgi:hypothetical protein